MEIILFILFVVASVVFRILQPRIKGYLGEKSVATILSLLPSDKYKIINDLLIEVDGRTIQIDHLVVSIYGIFVIETKNYKGRITGSDIKFSETDIQKLYDKISLLNIVSPEVRKQHVLEIQNTIATKRHLIQQGICPRCGHSLILRNGKYGNFYGCSNYPNCKFIKPIECRNNRFLHKLTKKFIRNLLK